MRASTAPRVDKLVVVSNHATKEARNAWRDMRDMFAWPATQPARREALPPSAD